MNRRISITKYFAYIGELPLGCKICMKGLSIVIFITGLCDDRCFYCPVSLSKLHKDIVTVDEEEAHNISDIIAEAHRIGAYGAGITGGDPLKKMSRVVRVIAELKKEFGSDFHIHLYTSGRYATAATIRLLERNGLDEIRFHPTSYDLLDRVIIARKVSNKLRIGVEVPVLPDRANELKELITWLDKHNIEFINLNELEVSPTNIGELRLRGYRIDSEKNVVIGSEETALQVLEWASKNTKNIKVHYCPARYKDAIQLRLRLYIKAIRMRKPYETLTKYGTLKVLVVAEDEKTQKLAEEGMGEHTNSITILALDVEKLGMTSISGRVLEVYPLSQRLKKIVQLASKVKT